MTHIVKLALSKADETVLVQTTDEELPEGYEALGRAASGTHLLAIDELLGNGYGVKADDLTIKYSDKAEAYLGDAHHNLADNPDLSSQHQEVIEQVQNPEPVPVQSVDEQVQTNDTGLVQEQIDNPAPAEPVEETKPEVVDEEKADDSEQVEETQTDEEKKDAE